MEKEKRESPVILDYWKNYVTMQHVLACELSYSLIYNNIKPEKIKEALATVSLDTLPNRFLLIQVDDYYNFSSKMHITQEFYQKTELINLLRKRMNIMGLKGFMANLVGQDKLICFLCCREWEDDKISIRLLEVAEAFKEEVRTHSDYTISLCISKRCDRLNQYSMMYPRMNLALSKSYFSGKEFSIFLEELREEEKPEEINLNRYYPEILASFARGNRDRLEHILQSMIQSILESQMKPQKAKMEVMRFVQKIGEYEVRCGVAEEWMRNRTDEAMSRVLACSFIADTRMCFMEFYDSVMQAMKEHNTQEGYSFKIPVKEYIDTHYMEEIRLGTVAEMMGFSEGHFTRIFRKEFGMTFIQYLTGCRIQHSKELLKDTSISIEQIAYQVGMNSYSYFCTCFKRFCGISPGVFRELERQNQKFLNV